MRSCICCTDHTQPISPSKPELFRPPCDTRESTGSSREKFKMPQAKFSIKDHMIVTTTNFRTEWDRWHSRHLELAKPSDGEMREILGRCYWVDPSTITVPVVGDRAAFRNPDFPGYIFVVKLEHVTTDRPVGEAVFIGMVSENRIPPSRLKYIGCEAPVFEPPADSVMGLERRNYFRRKISEMEDWIRIYGQNHRHYQQVTDALARYTRESVKEEDSDIQGLVTDMMDLRKIVEDLRRQVEDLKRRQAGHSQWIESAQQLLASE